MACQVQALVAATTLLLGYRLNYKLSSIPTTTIFAQATGFKVAWKLPTGSTKNRKRRNIEEIHDHARLVYESHGFNGKACVKKNICQVLDYVGEKEGVIGKILKLLIGKGKKDSKNSMEEEKICEKEINDCPLELLGINNLINSVN